MTGGTVIGTYVSWAILKGLKDTLSLILHYVEDDRRYDLRILNGPIMYKTSLYKAGHEPAGLDVNQNALDLGDFETNYKADANGLEKQAVEVTNTFTNPVSIAIVPAVVPGGATKVNQVAYSSISADSDTTYTIPNGETLVIQSLTGGSEFKSQGCAVELWYDPDGDGSVMTIVDVIHINGSSEQHSLYAQFEGNGTRKIRMRRRAFAGGSRECFGRWEGYY